MSLGAFQIVENLFQSSVIIVKNINYASVHCWNSSSLFESLKEKAIERD